MNVKLRLWLRLYYRGNARLKNLGLLHLQPLPILFLLKKKQSCCFFLWYRRRTKTNEAKVFLKSFPTRMKSNISVTTFFSFILKDSLICWNW